MSSQEHLTKALEKNGLYAGNIILELVPDAKGVKPSVKVNNLADDAEIENALANFSVLCKQVHVILREADLPITYELAAAAAVVDEAKSKKSKSSE